MEGKKNLCAMISTDLHTKIMAEKEQLELNTLAEYVERIFTEHFEGGQISMKAERTLAVQIPAELFERLKEYLAARSLKQKQFLIQLIENALDDTEEMCIRDSNMDSGGSGMGDGTKTNYWNPGMDGVRLSVVHADNRAVIGSVVDWSNQKPNAPHFQ